MRHWRHKKNGFGQIARKYGIKLVILFGSRAKDTTGLKGDSDIAILTQKSLNDQKEYNMFQDFIQFFRSDNLDLAVLNFASPLLRFQVAKDGQLLYERQKGDFQNFQLMAIKDYWLNRKFLKLQHIYLNKAIKKL